MQNVLAGLICLCLLTSLAGAQEPFEFWPGASYDPAIPTHQKVLGYKAGDRITSHADIVRFLEALAVAAPSRMKVFEYGRTWEDRRLVYVIIGSEANIARLDEIQTGMKKLSDPRQTGQAEADQLIESLPAPVWLAYGVHGNEISSPDAALMTAYHLLAAQGDTVVEKVLEDALVFIDPLQNPDGRTRFINHFIQSEGLEPNSNPEALEHTEAWPGGRTNHYLFDMNRDWFALTQPETRGRVKALQQWYPLVFVDLHEMGSNSTYYFAPEAIPYNPHLTKDQRASLDWFGKNNARWFDQFGFSYFTKEVFDAFYPGYGASWPAYYGSVAMTYEQASARGLLMERRRDGKVFHFRETVRQHFVASVSTCETAAERSKDLLRNFYNYGKTAIEEGSKEKVKAYVFPRKDDVPAVDKLADILAAQGVEVQRAKTTLDVDGKQAPPGSYVVNLAQPAKRLIRTLLDPDVQMEEHFLKEQERLRKKDLPDEIYDVVAWSLPLLYNVEMLSSGKAISGDLETVTAGAIPPGEVTGGEAKLAYLVPWNSRASVKLLTAALRKGLKVWTADKELTLSGKQYPRGTLILRTHENPGDFHETVRKLAADSGATVHATDSGYVEKGISLGSNRVIPIRKPSIAIAWDTPTSSYSAGQTRFVIERQFGYPVTPIRARYLSSPAVFLDRFDVLVWPDTRGGYARELQESGMKRLKEWVNNGGTLIGIAGAMVDLADPKHDLLTISRETQPREEKDQKKEATKREARVPGKLLEKEDDFQKAILPEKELPDSIPGIIATARTDPDHWITAGVKKTVTAMVRGRSIYTPIKLDKGVNAAVFLGPNELLAGGYLWEDNRKQLAYKPLVVVQPVGQGFVVGFTTDPNFRAYMDGMNMLFMNALFRSQAKVRAGR